MPSRTAFTTALLRMNETWPLAEAAKAFAAAGVPVFPCAPLGKRPLIRDGQGFRDATTDLTQIAAWWSRVPEANIGIPTGAASGVVVVDVDVHGPVNGYRRFARADRAGLVDGWEVLARSPSGGMHAYYPATAGVEQRSWQDGRAGIDFRGDGGYIIAPPSRRIIDGRPVPYTVQTFAASAGSPLDASQLRDFLDPQPAQIDRPARTVVESGADVSRLAAWVSRRQEGERNHGLFWAACKLAENEVAPSDALDVLTAAAGHAGLSEREAVTTIRSAYRAVHGGSRGSPTSPSPSSSRFAAPEAASRVRVRGL
ncbi:bifunctional DNA primase/polymerase [Paramicrobacterium fandaimingii]|uniref:bifunctional DNA primase/polymerase n=1 Tax=Paramicrobacterium fandaimingii TaxID=2708079 RepID=UPI001420F583|nr:bifunctional DNA primase/polymerase [Microbacterium fandaimingii]